MARTRAGPAQGRRHRRPPGREASPRPRRRRRGCRRGRPRRTPIAGGSATATAPTRRVRSGPDRPAQRPDDLAEPVQAEDEEGVERELLDGPAAAQAGEERGAGDAEAEDEGDGEPQPRGRARGQRARRRSTTAMIAGEARSHLARPANGRAGRGSGPAGSRGSGSLLARVVAASGLCGGSLASRPRTSA